MSVSLSPINQKTSSHIDPQALFEFIEKNTPALQARKMQKKIECVAQDAHKDTWYELPFRNLKNKQIRHLFFDENVKDVDSIKIGNNKITRSLLDYFIKIFKKFADHNIPGAEEKLQDLTRMEQLYKKYHSYIREYENPEKAYTFLCSKDRQETLNSGNPQLLDALASGTSFPYGLKCSQPFYSEIVEQDIKDIVRLTPKSLHCPLASIKSITVSPLFVACLNRAIPEYMVEFLLQNGADPNTTINAHGWPTYLLKILENQIPDKRYAKLEEIFLRNGLDPNWASKRLPYSN